VHLLPSCHCKGWHGSASCHLLIISGGLCNLLGAGGGQPECSWLLSFRSAGLPTPAPACGASVLACSHIFALLLLSHGPQSNQQRRQGRKQQWQPFSRPHGLCTVRRCASRLSPSQSHAIITSSAVQREAPFCDQGGEGRWSDSGVRACPAGRSDLVRKGTQCGACCGQAAPQTGPPARPRHSCLVCDRRQGPLRAMPKAEKG